jgi:hypothetical protein
MIGIPERTESAEYYFKYIDRIKDRDILGRLEEQLHEVETFLHGISEEKSLFRYAAEKWSIRQLWSHVNDTERVFLFRALWFARGFETPLPSFDQDVAVIAARADERSWASHVAEFQVARRDTLAFFRGLPEEAWMRRGEASGNPFTVRALAYIIAGHAAHHVAVLQEKYLS